MDITQYINVKRTIDELGVDITKLKPNSEKLVYKICEICKNEEIKKFRYIFIFKQTKCLNCSNQLNGKNNRDKISEGNKKYFKTHKHPRLGVKHTEEAKKKIVANRKPYVITDEYRKKISESMRGPKNPSYGKKLSPEAIEKIRERSIKNARRGKDSNFYGKSYYAKRILYTKKDGIIYNLKSGWEFKFAQYLDSKNIIWEYEKQYFPVIYEYEGKTKDGTYIPDFFIDNIIYEIKGYWRKDALAKFEAFKKTYPEIKIIILGRKELRNLGIHI